MLLLYSKPYSESLLSFRVKAKALNDQAPYFVFQLIYYFNPLTLLQPAGSSFSLEHSFFK